MLSGVGLILLFVDFWYIYRLMYKDEPAVTFFLVIAANQVGLCLCASFISGMLHEEWLGGAPILAHFGTFILGHQVAETKLSIDKLIVDRIERDHSPNGAK